MKRNPKYVLHPVLALQSERFARIATENLTKRKCQVVYSVAMLANMVIRANLMLTVAGICLIFCE
jgi:hypothetical protein